MRGIYQPQRGARMIFLGPPGAGKGTQAGLLAKKLGIPQISTGEILREAREKRTGLGLQAERYMKEGRLVPDELVVGLVKERVASADCASGYILDGFPRNLLQARSLKEKFKVFFFEVPEEELVKRLLGRGREDDTREVVSRRLAVYEQETSPLIDYYKKQGALTTIRGEGSIDEIFKRLSDAVLK